MLYPTRRQHIQRSRVHNTQNTSKLLQKQPGARAHTLAHSVSPDMSVQLCVVDRKWIRVHIYAIIIVIYSHQLCCASRDSGSGSVSTSDKSLTLQCTLLRVVILSVDRTLSLSLCVCVEGIGAAATVAFEIRPFKTGRLSSVKMCRV